MTTPDSPAGGPPLPLRDVRPRDRDRIPPGHAWPPRLVVPHRGVRTSGTRVRGVAFLDADRAGVRERPGHHVHGDPRREQRRAGLDVERWVTATVRRSSKAP